MAKQTEGTGASTPQKTEHATSERGLYIPSVDLLTAQVNSALRGEGRKSECRGKSFRLVTEKAA